MVTGSGVPGRIIGGWEGPVFFPGHVTLVWKEFEQFSKT
jgi:hypothetical protein